jgi:hypothetical protein
VWVANEHRTQKQYPGYAASAAKFSIDYIQDLKRRKQKFIDEHKWSITINTYKAEPRFFGILIADNKLFRGDIFLEDGQLRGGQRPPQIFYAGDDDFDQFKMWFMDHSRPIDSKQTWDKRA